MSAAIVEGLSAMADELKKQNEFAEKVTAVSLREAWRGLADVISGQIGGYGDYAGNH